MKNFFKSIFFIKRFTRQNLTTQFYAHNIASEQILSYSKTCCIWLYYIIIQIHILRLMHLMYLENAMQKLILLSDMRNVLEGSSQVVYILYEDILLYCSNIGYGKVNLFSLCICYTMCSMHDSYDRQKKMSSRIHLCKEIFNIRQRASDCFFHNYSRLQIFDIQVIRKKLCLDQFNEKY